MQKHNRGMISTIGRLPINYSFQSLLGLAALTTADFCEPRLIGYHLYYR